MASKTQDLETKLDELFVRNAPRLPKGLKKALVAWMPLISFILGILSLLSAVGLWRWAHAAEKLVGVCNAYSVSGCGNISASRFSIWLWLGVALITVSGILYLLAYPGLRDHKKEGWRYLYYAVLLDVVYAIVSLFTGYYPGVNFLLGMLGSGVGFYVLFQTRDLYAGKKRVVAMQSSRGAEKKEKIS